MKTILLMRHAKSSWDDPSLADFDRPLNNRGLKAAPFMARLLKEKGLKPDILVTSPAARASATAEIVSKKLRAKLETDARIYEASLERLRDVAVEFTDEARSAMLVGHNPGMEAFLRYLTGEVQPMPTAAVAVIETNVDEWIKLSEKCGRLVEIYRPRELM